jgi:hypothetical protein
MTDFCLKAEPDIWKLTTDSLAKDLMVKNRSALGRKILPGFMG